MSQRQLCVRSRLLPYLSWSPNLKCTRGPHSPPCVDGVSTTLPPQANLAPESPPGTHTRVPLSPKPPSVFLSTSGLSHALLPPWFLLSGGRKSQHLRRFEIISFRRACVAKFCASCWGCVTSSVLPSREQEKDLRGGAGPEHTPWLQHFRARITRHEAGEEGLAQRRHWQDRHHLWGPGGGTRYGGFLPFPVEGQVVRGEGEETSALHWFPL